ncbi:hypothetical protein FHS95_002003 [Sphingomonas naasensis]|uniref:Uncharacterized protein n=1 Tax=Sphingomonas naasensis TaxID=1344951 RepID=A0A4S1WNF6_9SPHN|nr:hypothetical protein [Sphingomonas naasensis]NIJ20311.1 hypothetical protein [Sphingomonas naasensis]TGX44433.1 hypothetical protein E5A74_06495 [Sphingomonas naasensis]
MIRILPSFAAALAACTPSPQETAMHRPGQDPATNARSTGEAGPGRNPTARAGDPQRAAPAPPAEPVSAAENPAPSPPVDSPAEAIGRRILSTAFVRVGPDGHLTVELHNGRALILRDVVMRRKDYCGVQMLGGKAGSPYCGGYSEVAAARPGGSPATAEPDLAAPNPLEARGSSAKRN